MRRTEIHEGQRAAAEALQQLCASILVVDSDTDSLATLTGLLRADGHECTAASSGSEALRQCALQRFDCMLIENVLAGGVTGLAVAQRLGGSGSSIRPTYILLMTDAVRDEFGTSIRDRVIDGHLLKPVTLEVLREHVGKSLRFARA